jgi:hypothetical protein
MARAVSVLVAVVVLLGVGWYVGYRPARALQNTLAEERRVFGERSAALETRTREAEARAHLWAARGELLAAALDVRDRNFGLAGERAARARDLITLAAGLPGNAHDLGTIRDMAERTLPRIEALDPTVEQALRRTAEELARLVEQGGSA